MELIYLPSNEDINFFNLIRDRSIHYVSIAMPGLTIASGLVDNALAENGRLTVEVTERRYALMSRINHARETGTLYPIANITLLPSPVESDRFGLSSVQFVDGQYGQTEICHHIDDAFLANREYIGAESMYFDFRNLCVSAALYNRCLEESLKSVTDSNLQKVIAWTPDSAWEQRLLGSD